MKKIWLVVKRGNAHLVRESATNSAITFRCGLTVDQDDTRLMVKGGDTAKKCPACSGDVKIKKIDGWDRLGFINYLESRLIPDLKESGRTATAEDFETAVKFMKEVSK